jgi:hypothetical protein
VVTPSPKITDAVDPGGVSCTSLYPSAPMSPSTRQPMSV